MAVEFDKELVPSLTRTSEYLIDPREVMVKPELNGRFELPEIDDLIAGFMELGQLQPCLIGRDGGAAVLYAGHRRWRAAIEITNRKLLPVTKDNPEQVFKLRCVYFKGDERTAFLATVAENHDRKGTTEIDDAHNIVKMQRWNMSDESIAAVYRKDVAWVQARAKLIDLCDEAIEAVKSGRMKPTAAVAIAKLAKSAQREKLIAAGDGKVTTAMLRDAPANGNGNHRLLTSKQIVSFWKPIAESPVTEFTKPLDRNIQKLASLQVELLNGADPDSIWSQIRKLVKD